MKRTLWVAGILLMAGVLNAEQKRVTQPEPGNFSSQAVYTSSNTSATTFSVVVSSKSASLHTVNVNSSGTNSSLEIWDSRTSTNSAQRKIAKIDTTSKVSLTYNIDCSSGITINNQGNPPADVTLSYRER